MWTHWKTVSCLIILLFLLLDGGGGGALWESCFLLPWQQQVEHSRDGIDSLNPFLNPLKDLTLLAYQVYLWNSCSSKRLSKTLWLRSKMISLYHWCLLSLIFWKLIKIRFELFSQWQITDSKPGFTYLWFIDVIHQSRKILKETLAKERLTWP